MLEIQNVTHEHEGWYACIAANSLGQTITKAYLKVVDTEPGKYINISYCGSYVEGFI